VDTSRLTGLSAVFCFFGVSYLESAPLILGGSREGVCVCL
jgi:hypothetical protein